jgi:hypothetical protein
MTVLVGVRCKDGVVIGSDSAKTSSDGAGRFTTYAPGTKIDIVDDRIILAHTGQAGMAQRFQDVVSNGWSSGAFKHLNTLNAMRKMSELARKDFSVTLAPQGQYGSLVAMKTSKDSPALCEFAISDFQPELKTDIWYCSMGSGQSVVDPLLALFRKAFWSDGPPKLSEGILATCWALELAIELCPFGVAGPIKVAVLDSQGKAQFLADQDLDGHRENAQRAIEYFGLYTQQLLDTASAPDIPKPP